MATFMAPSSYGEALDRLTILELKLRYIHDSRRTDVQREYDELKSLLQDLLEKDPFHYSKLLEVNGIMWHIQDLLHENTQLNHEQRYFLMEQLAIENQRRFRIKRTMNEILGSHHKEQKGYKGKKAFVLPHLGMGDQLFMNSAVRFLTTLYDEVKVVVKDINLENLKILYSDEPSVTFHVVKEDKDISPHFGCPVDVFESVIKGFDFVGLCGLHKKMDLRNIDLPLDFYKEFHPAIETSCITKWSHIPFDSSKYADFLQEFPHFVFYHNKASNATASIPIDIEEKLVINPATNMYPEGHKWYEAAQKWVGLPLLEYCSVLQKAEKCLMVDSSFFCLAVMMGLRPEVWIRNGRTYRTFVPDLVEHPLV